MDPYKRLDTIDMSVPFHEKNQAKSLGAKWDWKRRTWIAPHGEKSLTERWGGPPQKKRRVESRISNSAWTVERVSNCANGKEIVVNVEREPWEREDEFM